MDYENASQIGIGIKRYVMLKTLLVIYENELMDLIGKLDEIQDKEFASNLYKSLSGDAKQCLTVLKENETTDLENIKKLSSTILALEPKIAATDKLQNALSVEFANLKKEISSTGKITKYPGLIGKCISGVLMWGFFTILADNYGKISLSQLLFNLMLMAGLAGLPFIYARRRYGKLVDKLESAREKMGTLGKEIEIAEKNKVSLTGERDKIDATFNSLLAKYELQEMGLSSFNSI